MFDRPWTFYLKEDYLLVTKLAGVGVSRILNYICLFEIIGLGWESSLIQKS
jgi:hypothetical protein